MGATEVTEETQCMTLAYPQAAHNLVCSARTPRPLISQGTIDYLQGTATQGTLAFTGRGKPQGLSHLCLTSLGLPDKNFLFPSRSLIHIFPLGLLKKKKKFSVLLVSFLIVFPTQIIFFLQGQETTPSLLEATLSFCRK